MPDMTKAPIPIAIPAMAPGLSRWPLLFGSVGGGVATGVVVFEGVSDESPVATKGTLITEASDDA